MTIFYIMMSVYALLNFVYAFKEPPTALRSILKVPGIFIFLPDHLVIPVGRIFMGCVTLFLLVFLYIKVGSVSLPTTIPQPIH